MLFYLAVYLITLLFFIVAAKSKPQNKKILLILAAVFIAIFAGLRYGVGTDYFFTYQPEYESILNNQPSYQKNFDIGVYAILWICAKTRLGFQFALFVISFITFLFFFLGINRFSNKDNKFLIIGCFLTLFLYYQLSYNIVRQVLAMSVLFYFASIDLTVEKKTKSTYVREIILLIAAVLFHKTSVIFMIIYLFKNFFSQKKYLWLQIIVLVAAVFLIMRNEMFGPVLDLLKLSSFKSYLKNVNLQLTIGYLIRMIPFILFVMLLLRGQVCKDRTTYFFVFMWVLGYLLRLLAYNADNDVSTYIPAAAAADRISMYFLIFQIYLYATAISSKSSTNFDKVLKATVFVSVIALWYFDNIYLGRNATLPYTTFFFEE